MGCTTFNKGKVATTLDNCTRWNSFLDLLWSMVKRKSSLILFFVQLKASEGRKDLSYECYGQKWKKSGF
jgi:hypothetical protein